MAERRSAARREAHGAGAEAVRAAGDVAREGTLTAVPGDPTAPLALDKIIHERMRLAIVSTLAVHAQLTFNELKALLETSDGNLSVHARKLEEAGYIACTKGFEGRVPRTIYRITPEGRRALDAYLAHMEALIRRVEGS
ncbi:MAG: winged helix-turn-helix domain-containing protein [Gemmatimonadaceae bacterium]